MIKIAILCSVIFSLNVFSHEGHHHAPHSSEQKKSEATIDVQLVYKKIQADFLQKIKPIFNQKCAVCHSSEAIAPWYASIFIAGGLITSDMAKAREHLEISKGFPFTGQGTPAEDLHAIKEVVVKDLMPTQLYLFFHSDKRLSNEEKGVILDWVNNSEKDLGSVSLRKKL